MTKKTLHFSWTALFSILVTLLLPSTAFCSGVDEEVVQEQKTLLSEIKFDTETLRKFDLKAGLKQDVFEEKLEKAFAETTKIETKKHRNKIIQELQISKDTIIFLTQLIPDAIYDFNEREFNEWILRAISTEEFRGNLKGTTTSGKKKSNSNNENVDSPEDSGNDNVGYPGGQQSQALARQYFNPQLLVGGSFFLAALFLILKR